MMLLRRHNLNLVPILRELLRTCSVSRTAERVGLSQSAVSAALSRLRAIFDDELLVPVGRHMELTQRAAELINRTESAYAELEALLQPLDFDPAMQTRRFVIATADYVALLMALRLAALMAMHAPKASIEFIDLPPNLFAEMLCGHIDVAIMPESSGMEIPPNIDSHFLFEDETVVIASRHHRSFQGELTRALYESARHAMFQISPRLSPRHGVVGLDEAHVEQQNLIFVQQFSVLPAIVESGTCLALVQKRLAEHCRRQYAIDLFAPPFILPPIRISALSPRSSARDPAHRWFCSMLDQAFPDVP